MVAITFLPFILRWVIQNKLFWREKLTRISSSLRSNKRPSLSFRNGAPRIMYSSGNQMVSSKSNTTSLGVGLFSGHGSSSISSSIHARLMGSRRGREYPRPTLSSCQRDFVPTRATTRYRDAWRPNRGFGGCLSLIFSEWDMGLNYENWRLANVEGKSIPYWILWTSRCRIKFSISWHSWRLYPSLTRMFTWTASYNLHTSTNLVYCFG